MTTPGGTKQTGQPEHVGRPAAAAARWRPQVPLVVATAMRVAALLAIVGVLRPDLRENLVGTTAYVPRAALFAVSITTAGVLLVLARGIRLRKRRAFWLTVGASALGVLSHLATRSWGDAALNLVIFGLLVITRRDFAARSEPESRWLALRAFLLLSLAAFVGGMILTSRAAPGSSFLERARETFFGLFGFTPNLEFREADLSTLTQTALATLGLLVLLVSLTVLLLPTRVAAHLEPEEEAALRALLDKHGDRDSLGYFALRRDKSVVFSRTGKAAIAYRVIGGVSLASGDPIGDPEAWPGAIEAWLAEVDGFGYTPGVLGAGERGAETYARAGFDALELGDEAVLELADLSLEGRAMRPVRQAVNRVARAGYTSQVRRQGDLDPTELAEVMAAAESFRNGEVERGFSMALGRLGDPDDPGIVLVTARDGEGALVAVLGFVPWGSRGLSLDVMRRARGSENGTVEFLVMAAAAAGPALGIERLSLNFAVFRSAFARGDRIGAGPVLRLWRQVLLVASKWWQIESLYRANVKYQPVWIPRFVCFRRSADLPRIGIAALKAEAFITIPSLGRATGSLARRA